MSVRLAVLAFPALAILTPHVASAEPSSRITAGVALGMTQASADSDAGYGSTNTLGLFARVALGPRVGVQLEVDKLDAGDNNGAMNVYAANATIDLGHGRWMPMLLAGAGLDRQDNQYQYTHAHHVEAGVGLEYRADGGFVAGVDVRIGSRSIDDQSIVAAEPLYVPVPSGPAPRLSDGEYRSARLYMGVHF